MNRQEILLKEYEVCQSHNNALGNQSWISISILVTVNLLLMGQVIYNIMLKSVPICGCGNLVVIILLGAGMITILKIFQRWQRRINFQVLLNNERMREIETALGMWKNWRVYGLDLEYGYGPQKDLVDWKALCPSQKEYIKQLGQRHKLLRCKDKLSQLKHTLSWWKKQDENREKNGELRYEPPTTKGFPRFNCVFTTLYLLWSLVIVMEILIYSCLAVRECLFNF